LAAQALGADFAYKGSAFIATEEAQASDVYKQAIVDGTSDDVVYSNFATYCTCTSIDNIYIHMMDYCKLIQKPIATEKIQEIITKLKIPFVTSWLGKDIVNNDNNLFINI
jgi:NAD(P)H-dependent flavin oxidoreductase YrpB (nitropropane dioxygenase family)